MLHLAMTCGKTNILMTDGPLLPSLSVLWHTHLLKFQFRMTSH